MPPKVKVYDAYDYETIFDQILKAEHEEALKIESLLRGKHRRLMCAKTIKYGTQLDCEIYPAYFSRHDIPRDGRRERTVEQMRDLNDRNARKTAIRLININFGKDDLWAEFGYDDEHLPGDEEQAQRDIRNFFKRVNYHRKKQGLPPAKYLYVTEYADADGQPVRVHHHAIMSGDMDRDAVEKLWTKCSRKYTRRVQPDDFGLKGMAAYITKVKHTESGRYIKRWGASKGLKQPKPTRSYSRFRRKKINTMVQDRNRMKEIFEAAYPGYLFIGCEVRGNSINRDVYLYAQLRRMPPGGCDKKGRGKAYGKSG